MLEQDISKKKQIKKVFKLEAGNNKSKRYEMEAILDGKDYIKKLESCHLLGLYYLVIWKSYPEEENTWEPASAVQHLRKRIKLFYKNEMP